MAQIQTYEYIEDIAKAAAKIQNMQINKSAAIGLQQPGSWEWDLEHSGQEGVLMNITYWSVRYDPTSESIFIPHPTQQADEDKQKLIYKVIEKIEMIKSRRYK